MTYSTRSVIKTILCALLMLGSHNSALQAATVLQNGAVVQLRQTASDQIALNIRLTSAADIVRVTARINAAPVSLSGMAAYPAGQQTNAILFLVDTSDPRRQRAVDQAGRHIEQITGAASAHVRFGLARFDTELTLLAGIGSKREQIIRQAKSLHAEGKTTELYRNMLVAIRELAKYPAERKFIFLLSDGLAEDRAYFHRDVVQAAIQNDISFYTLGYSGSVSQTVALQTLRRLSEDTGGQYIATRPGSFQIDPLLLQQMLGNMDSGVQLAASFKTVSQAGITGQQLMDLAIETTQGDLLLSIPVRLPGPPLAADNKAARAETVQPLSSQAASPAVIVQRRPEETPSTAYSTFLLLGISLLLLALLVFVLLRLRKLDGNSANDVSDSQEPYAWLERLDGGSPKRFPIDSMHVRIGRFRGNDVALHDPAVSRYHAEIRFTDDGKFMIADIGSKNGILVNDEEVYESTLQDNDILEIGDIRMRFTIQSDFAADMQNTQLFKTQFPLPGAANH